MRRLVYLTAATSQFDSTGRYIATQSGEASVGAAFVRKLDAKCRKMAGLKSVLGRPRPDLGPDLRSFAFGNYIIILRYTPDTLEIIAVFGGHQDIAARYHDDPSEP